MKRFIPTLYVIAILAVTAIGCNKAKNCECAVGIANEVIDSAAHPTHPCTPLACKFGNNTMRRQTQQDRPKVRKFSYNIIRQQTQQDGPRVHKFSYNQMCRQT